jgi:signal transduction histidine kinase
MNQQLQTILDFIQRSETLSSEEKDIFIKSLKAVDKELEITAFKLDRTEKVKRTTSILLEETIEELELKRKAIEETNAALTKSIDDLKAAQAQLIQSEKMASLGELTAGIAHEIQNPLNFVNNFSEVSKELMDEMKQELAVGTEASVQLANEIADDIKQNLEKINHHGKRAADIVKGMLQHSRTSSGQKEPIDINVLADEYLRLAYHGLRAKDKNFNVDFKTELDETLPKINVIPQDIGRVLLNLINNAFYTCAERTRSTVSEKKKHSSDEYKPIVQLTTKKSGDQIEIKVTDNGNGIPADILGKVFQPFFTTKPTGQGTGLGLSLSYDIVKAHGGELKVETRPPDQAGKESVELSAEAARQAGTTFIIQLPLS